MFAENMKSTIVHNYFREKCGSGKNGWTYLSYSQFIDLIQKRFGNIEHTTSGFLGCFGRNKLNQFILGKIDQLILKQFIPNKYNYIFICVAQK